MSAIPPSIRKILDSGRGEVRQLEREYHIWFITTIISALSCILLVSISLILFSVDTTDSLVLIRLVIGVVILLNMIITYMVFQETLARRRYLLEIQRLMLSGLSFLDSLRRGFRDMFGG
jgi:hypothetical protein